MKYFKIDREIINKVFEKGISNANGEFVPNGKHYFDRMGSGEIIENAPIFDYFHLQSFGLKEEWEWRKQDVHGFMGVGSIMTAWYISAKTKKLLEQFLIAKDYAFYETKLLFQGSKYDYWIFQYFQKGNTLPKSKYINFEKSIFIDIVKQELVDADNFEQYQKARNAIKQNSNYEHDIKIIKLVLNQTVDFFPLLQIHENTLVSEKLKNAIENAELEGFEFSELDYEVVSAPPIQSIF